MENPKRRRWLGWFFLAFAALMLLGGLGAVAWQHRDVRRYQPVPARVLSSSLTLQQRETTDGEGGRTTTTVYAPHISYEYQVGGRTYQSSRVFAWAMVETASRTWAQGFVDQYRPGEPATAYCNPADPRDAILTRRLSFGPYLVVAASMPFPAIAPVFSFVGGSLGMAAGFPGMLVGWITPLFMKDPIGGIHWAGYGAAAGAVVFAVIALVAGPSGKISWGGQCEDAEEPA